MSTISISVFLTTFPFVCLLYILYYRRQMTRDAEFLIRIFEENDESWNREQIIDLVRNYCAEKIYFHVRSLKSNSPYQNEAELEQGLQKYRTDNFLKNTSKAVDVDKQLERYCDPYSFEIHAVFNYDDPGFSNIVIVKVAYTGEWLTGFDETDSTGGSAYKSHYYSCRYISNRWLIDKIHYTNILPIESYAKKEEYNKQLSKMKQKKLLTAGIVYVAVVLFLGIFNQDVDIFFSGLVFGLNLLVLGIISHFTIKLLFPKNFKNSAAEKLKQAV